MKKISMVVCISIIFFTQVVGMETKTSKVASVPVFTVVAIKKRWKGSEQEAIKFLDEAKKTPGDVKYRKKNETLGSFNSTTEKATTYVEGKPYTVTFEQFIEIISRDFDTLALKNHDGNETDTSSLLLIGQVSDKSKKCCCSLY